MIHRLREHFARLRDDVRYQGAEVLAWRIVVKLLSPLVRLNLQILYEADLAKPLATKPPRVECAIRPIDEREVPRLVREYLPPINEREEARLGDDDEYARLLREREVELFRRNAIAWLRGGEQCFVATVGDEIVHFNWIRYAGCPPAPERPVHLDAGEVYTTGAFTPPAWRGKGVHEIVNAAMLRHAQGLGYRRAYTIADLLSAGSRRGLLRVGWRRRGHHVFVTPRGVARTWIVRLGGDVEPVFAHFHDAIRVSPGIVSLRHAAA